MCGRRGRVGRNVCGIDRPELENVMQINVEKQQQQPERAPLMESLEGRAMMSATMGEPVTFTLAVHPVGVAQGYERGSVVTYSLVNAWPK